MEQNQAEASDLFGKVDIKLLEKLEIPHEDYKGDLEKDLPIILDDLFCK